MAIDCHTPDGVVDTTNTSPTVLQQQRSNCSQVLGKDHVLWCSEVTICCVVTWSMCCADRRTIRGPGAAHTVNEGQTPSRGHHPLSDAAPAAAAAAPAPHSQPSTSSTGGQPGISICRANRHPLQGRRRCYAGRLLCIQVASSWATKSYHQPLHGNHMTVTHTPPSTGATLLGGS
jgi:hypothetical protein